MLFCNVSLNLLLSSIGNSVPLLPTVSKVHQTLHIMWTNFLLSVTVQDGQYVTVPIYTCHVNMYVHVVWREKLWKWKVVCGNTVHNCMCRPWEMAHSTWHTTSTYKSTQSVGGSTVSSCPFISHLPYCEHGHWKTSDANIAINGYHECRWWG